MTIKTIGYEQLFPTGQFANQRLYIEASFAEGEALDPDIMNECYKTLKQTVNDAFHAMNPQQSWIPPSGFTTESLLEKVIPEINLEKDRVEILIDNAETPEELATYKDAAQKYGLQVEFYKKQTTLYGGLILD